MAPGRAGAGVAAAVTCPTPDPFTRALFATAHAQAAALSCWAAWCCLWLGIGSGVDPGEAQDAEEGKVVRLAERKARRW